MREKRGVIIAVNGMLITGVANAQHVANKRLIYWLGINNEKL